MNPHPIELHGCFTEEAPPQGNIFTPGFTPLGSSSTGTIYISDFNGDGVVDGTDVDDFQAAYARYRDDAPAPGPDRPFTVYATCDLNQDGKVDLDDWTMFHEAWDAAPSYPNAMGPLVDYFDANV